MLTVEPLNPPRLHCEGWGAPIGIRGHQNCDGGTGVWTTRRARWVRSDSLWQCGTCKRNDETKPGGWRLLNDKD